MKTEMKPRGALRLEPCSYGLSKLQFRGPRRPTQGRYAAILGGSDTFGKFIPKPYPDLVETAIGEVCVNLGCQSAGPDVFLYDTAIQSLCHDAAVTVIQALSAANLSNRFYKVHPRRNDRFIAANDALTRLYPEIDFADVAFTGHLISKLREADADRFALVQSVLEATWLRRMKTLVAQSGGPVIILWIAPRTPDEDSRSNAHPANDPIFVGRRLLEHLRPYVSDIIEIDACHGDTTGMSFAPLQAIAAAEMMGVAAHEAAARALRVPLLHAFA